MHKGLEQNTCTTLLISRNDKCTLQMKTEPATSCFPFSACLEAHHMLEILQASLTFAKNNCYSSMSVQA